MWAGLGEGGRRGWGWRGLGARGGRRLDLKADPLLLARNGEQVVVLTARLEVEGLVGQPQRMRGHHHTDTERVVAGPHRRAAHVIVARGVGANAEDLDLRGGARSGREWEGPRRGGAARWSSHVGAALVDNPDRVQPDGRREGEVQLRVCLATAHRGPESKLAV